MIRIRNHWINPRHISSIQLENTLVTIYLDNYKPYTEHPATSITCNFVTSELAKKFIDLEVSPRIEETRIHNDQINNLTNKILDIESRLHDLELAIRYIPGGHEYQQAQQSFFLINDQSLKTQEFNT